MNVKKKARRVMSGLLTAVTVLSTVLSPAVAYASDDAGSVKKIPYYEEIKDQLDEDEVVTAKDYEIKVGDNFDVKSDYTGLTIQDDSKVKVTFQEAKDTDGNDFSTDYANSYKAVYYVEPQTTDHPTYQINRKIVVKEADQQKDRSQKVLLIRMLVLPMRQKQRILRLARLQRKLVMLKRRAKQN